MVDILLGTGGDLELAAGDVRTDGGLGTAALASLFTEARATLEEAASIGVQALAGWWPDSEADRWGSKLWLLRREKATRETLARAGEYARRALDWMVEDGIASRIGATATSPRAGELDLEVRIVRGLDSRWAHAWSDPGPLEHESGGLRVNLSLLGGGA